MKYQKIIFYGCLFLIAIIYIFSLSFVRTDALYIYLSLIINFIFIINYLFYPTQNIKHYINQFLIVIIFMAIPFLFHSIAFGSYHFFITSLYLFDLGMIFGKLIGENIHLEDRFKKSLFIIFPMIVLLILPLFYIEPETLIAKFNNSTLYITREPPASLFFIFLLSVYACSIVFLSDRHSKLNLILSVLLVCVITVLIFFNYFAQYSLYTLKDNFIMQLINILLLLISYSIFGLYHRHKSKTSQ